MRHTIQMLHELDVSIIVEGVEEKSSRISCLTVDAAGHRDFYTTNRCLRQSLNACLTRKKIRSVSDQRKFLIKSSVRLKRIELFCSI